MVNTNSEQFAMNSLIFGAVSFLLLTVIKDSVSSSDPPGKRNLLSEGLITSFIPADASCCVASNCSQGETVCAIDDNPTTVWTLRNGTQKAHIDVQLNASSLVSDIWVMLSSTSVLPSSIVVTTSGTKITWTTYFNETCQPNDDYLRLRNSQYYSCQRSGDHNLTVSIPDGLFSVHNDSGDWLWWEVFNGFQLTLEANDADYSNTNTSGSIEIEDVMLYGWDEPRSSCNCHPAGVKDTEEPCSGGECQCRYTTTPNDRCIPSAAIADPTYGPVSGGTIFITIGNYLTNVTNVTLGDRYVNNTSPYNETLLQIKTSAGSQTDLHSPIPARIYWERPQGAVSFIVANWEFTYRPDPIIDSISPRASILGGGIPQTVVGQHLDSVAFPYITIVIQSNGPTPYFANFTNSKLEANDRFCHHINSTRLECISPGTDNYDYFSNEQGTLMISMDIDRYKDYTKCEIADCKFTRHLNPLVNKWNDEIVYNVYDGKKKFQVHGNNFLVGSGREDYMLTVGGVSCEIIEIITNLITFYPPDPSNFTSVDDSKSTILYIGYYSFTVGRIQYYLSWIDNPVNRNGLIIGLVCGVGGVVIIILAIVLIRMHLKSKQEEQAAQTQSATTRAIPNNEDRYTTTPWISSGVPRPTSSLLEYLNPELKEKVVKILVPYSQIHFDEKDELGSGNFGKVYRGVFFKSQDETEDVAIKTIPTTSVVEWHEKVSFLEEATIMADFSHRNVLSSIGVVIDKELPYVVLPLMELGDLRDFVSKPEKELTVCDLTSYCLQVAQGMEYLAKNKFIHRDLAARNCMINKAFVVKVADFGLARDIFEKDYYRTTDFNRPLPVKWMAIECLSSHNKFTESSDVWSFGILMWEVFTRGRKPYADVDNLELKRFLVEGRRLEQPRHTPDFIYSLMMSCWNETSTDRPTFKDIVEYLHEIMSYVPEPGTNDNRASFLSLDEATDVDQIEPDIESQRPDSYLELTPLGPSSYLEQLRQSVSPDD